MVQNSLLGPALWPAGQNDYAGQNALLRSSVPYMPGEEPSSWPNAVEGDDMPPSLGDVYGPRMMTGLLGGAGSVGAGVAGLMLASGQVLPALGVGAGAGKFMHQAGSFNNDTEQALAGRDAYNNEYGDSLTPRYDPDDAGGYAGLRDTGRGIAQTMNGLSNILMLRPLLQGRNR